MSFTTFTYLVFLGAVFTLYWLLRARTAQNLLLLVASYCFYAWWDYRFCSLMAVSSLADYLVGLGLARAQGSRARKALVGVSLLVNLGLLGFFKYFDFFVESLAAGLAALGIDTDLRALGIVLPVGISFYTFQTMSYTIDVYRRKIEPSHELIDYLAYVSFFPQLVAGPIERAGRLLPQFLKPRRFDYPTAIDGGRQIVWGIFKKLVLADGVAEAYVNPVYNDWNAHSGPELIWATAAFAIQIYCDFSAYSDIAIGTAKMLGFQLMRNFAYPYFAQSVAEFWRRWHISLSTWFRDYLYVPLGGSRVSRWRRAFNIMVTFTVSGMWHGASWKFLFWGVLHGIYLLPTVLWPAADKVRGTDTPGGERRLPPWRVIWRIGLTFALVNFAWVFFRARTFADALGIAGRMFSDAFYLHGYREAWRTLVRDENPRIAVVLVLFVIVEWLQRRRDHALDIPGVPRPVRWTIYTVLLWLALYLGVKRNDAFIYFQF